MYVEAVFTLGQSHRTVCSSTQQHITNGVLIDLDVLAQSVDLVVIGQHFMLDLALLPNALGLRPILLKVCFAGFRHLLAEDGQSLDSIDQINRKELVVDGGLATLVTLQIGKITRIGGWMGKEVLGVSCLLRCILWGKLTTVSAMQSRTALLLPEDLIFALLCRLQPLLALQTGGGQS